MEFCAFDQSYVDRLRAGDFRTQQHFVSYFTELIQVKLRSRVRSPQVVEDIRQETFSRVFAVLRSPAGIRQPEKLGAFVNSTCNNVLLEHYRSSSRDPLPEDDGLQEEHPDSAPDALAQVVSRQMQEQVRHVLNGLSERDRRLIREILLEERSKDEVCRELGVDREYLRVLLYRARQSFKTEYLRSAAGSARSMK